MAKKVTFILPTLARSGAERVVTSVANNLSRKGFNVEILVLRLAGPDDSALLSEIDDHVVVSCLNIEGRFIFNLRAIVLGINQYLRNQTPSVAFFCSGTTNAFFSLFLPLFPKTIKYYARESNLPSLYETNIFIRCLYFLTYKRFDIVIVQSIDMMNDLVKHFGIPKTKLVLINNPVDVSKIREKSTEVPKVSLPQNKINILCLGRLSYQKGFDIAIEAMATVRNREGIHLSIIGDGEQKAKLEALICDLKLTNSVTLHESIDNPWSVIRSSDLVLSPSRWEGYPNVVLEARALGIPVMVAPYRGGVSELVDSLKVSVWDRGKDFESQILTAIQASSVFEAECVLTRGFQEYEELLI